MPTQNPQLVTDEIYHIILRGVGDNVIFKNENDYYRGIFSIYEFNNNGVVSVWKRRRERIKEKTGQGQTLPDRDLFVEILAFSLMPNHIHLLLKQLKNNGISQFMQKLGTGYATYFNKKYNRKGHLFNRFHAVHIENDEQLKNAFVYVHTNALSLIEPGWKEKGIENQDKAIKFLSGHKWHSYPDYIGEKNFTSVTSRDFLLDIMGGVDGCEQAVEDWIRHKKLLKDFGDIVLE